MDVPHVSVLLPTYRQPETLLLTLRDLEAQDYPSERFEIVILDDGSGDGSSELALRVLPHHMSVTIKRRVRGTPYSHSNIFNELIRLSRDNSDVFVHVEDVRLREDFLRQHAKWHQTTDCFLITGPMCEGPVETFHSGACARWKLMQMAEAHSEAFECCFQAIFAKSMSYSLRLRRALCRIPCHGPFDEKMSGWGYHETEFALRAQKCGARCVYDQSCCVYHPTHMRRDELAYRKLNAPLLRNDGAKRNIRYLCKKHKLRNLPKWRVGRPIMSPKLIG
jgi:cellulose synthase/poly-beta-1,6-N-acetylglucosamine synthase-like glycosyltransferase